MNTVYFSRAGADYDPARPLKPGRTGAKKMRLWFLIWQSAETLYEPRHQSRFAPSGHRWQRALASRPAQRKSRTNARSARTRIVQLSKTMLHLALKASSLQWMEGEKEPSMRMPRSLTTYVACMASPGIPVANIIEEYVPAQTI